MSREVDALPVPSWFAAAMKCPTEGERYEALRDEVEMRDKFIIDLLNCCDEREHPMSNDQLESISPYKLQWLRASWGTTARIKLSHWDAGS